MKIMNKNIPLKIGLKGSMLLNEIANSNVEENTDLILHYTLLSNQPLVVLDYLRDLPAGKRTEIAYEILNEPRPSNEKIKELYAQAVGEVGINPDAFWNMTEEEVNLAYEGYIHRQELQVNLMQLAMFNALAGSKKPISLIENKGYRVGNINERNQCFQKLGI